MPKSGNIKFLWYDMFDLKAAVSGIYYLEEVCPGTSGEIVIAIYPTGK